MPSFMFLDLVFIVPPLIDKEKRKQKKKKKLWLLYKCLSAIFAMNSKLNNKRGT